MMRKGKGNNHLYVLSCSATIGLLLPRSLVLFVHYSAPRFRPSTNDSWLFPVVVICMIITHYIPPYRAKDPIISIAIPSNVTAII